MSMSYFDLKEAESEYIKEIGMKIDVKGWTISSLIVHPGVIEVTYKLPTLGLRVKTTDVARFSFTEMSEIRAETATELTYVTFRIQRINVR